MLLTGFAFTHSMSMGGYRCNAGFERGRIPPFRKMIHSDSRLPVPAVKWNLLIKGNAAKKSLNTDSQRSTPSFLASPRDLLFDLCRLCRLGIHDRVHRRRHHHRRAVCHRHLDG